MLLSSPWCRMAVRFGVPELKGMVGLQIAFFGQLFKLRRGISSHGMHMFAGLAEVPWQRTWWSQVLCTGWIP